MNGSSAWRRERGGNARECRALTARATPVRKPERDGWLRRDFWLCQSVWLSVALSFACQASVQAEARASSEKPDDEEIKSYDRPLEAPMTTQATESDFVAGAYALFGARHDLNYAGPKAPICACLAVALRDQAKDAAFQWELEEPRLEPSTQWIIALSSNEVPCDNPPRGTLGASYQGYGTEGNDVVVYVEALGEGRPMTSGAIIPRPKASGSVFVEPTNAVYGKPLQGKTKRCKLNPPGSTSP
jgi:hypothetical protein